MSLEVRPISFRPAIEFVRQHHRHHGATSGCKWCIGAYDGDRLVGVAICCRPVARKLDDGTVCEVARLCTDGTFNACSLLYAACARVAKEMGYRKIITYILETENGASLRAAGWDCDGPAGGKNWTGERYRQEEMFPLMKIRYSKHIGR